MRVSVPTIPQSLPGHVPRVISLEAAVERIATFLAPGNCAALTGAGVSVDSGIRAYRGKDGRYMNPNYKPIFYHELVDETEKGHAFRQRYWLRSFLGYPPVRDALPNTTHFAIAALQHTNVIHRLITQNVDGLHAKAVPYTWGPVRREESILELHGTLHKVRCKRGHVVDRDSFQDSLAVANPKWRDFALQHLEAGTHPRTNPDGDVALEGVDYTQFVVPDCPACSLENHRNSVQKPEVIFFGESIPIHVKERSFRDIDECDRLLIVGTTLATFSAFRLVKHALEHKKPILMLNLGPTRADSLPGIEKIELSSGTILRDVVRSVLGPSVDADPVVEEMLNSGVYQSPVDDDDDDRTPRAAG